MHLSKTILARLTAAILAISIATLPCLAIQGTVNADGGLRMRERSSTGAGVITTVPNNATVEVLATTESGWFQVSYNNLVGFVAGEYLAVDEAQAKTLEVLPEPLYGRVTEGPLNVRSGPGTSHDKVKQLSTGTVIEILEVCDGWYKIEGGYVSAAFITQITADEALNSSSAKGDEVAAYAKQYLGSRYVYGGSSPSGFDCSGFVRYIYSQFGFSLNRTASAQMDHGTSVSMSELIPGDLVFFKKAGSGASRASHVGIYIGGGQFIHASTSSTGVIISNMNSAYYTTGFVGGRRLV